MRLMDGGIFRPVSSRKILSMGVSALAVRRNIHHFGGNHTPRSRAASLNVLKCGRAFSGGALRERAREGLIILHLFASDAFKVNTNREAGREYNPFLDNW